MNGIEHMKSRKKNAVKVEWNGMIFESLAALARHNRVVNAGAGLQKYIRSGKPWKGHVIKKVK